MVVAALAAVSLLACGEEGVTPKNCPELPLRGDPDYDAKLQAAVDLGCATAAGMARSNTGGDPSPAEGGAGGQAGGESGAAGSAGS